ncbi:uncharacterized protein PHACADRAFT_160039 [Phanerochaete carnosa HHB-10118-sp]|uniref:Metallo-beta-lactamase domain-containing protein n=1 Tax=Phanerochaete carnosa (strain HHB-10118-sp) TaxID=650164 RepID=K5WC01_PHACS|nr:uncharacterized protein PHACADRAFT_160039 [Phanerochaete carnosa HHB-10118-sp]EKM56514.1 hypothetical protein PHACADRAFT_160039 [Phanerochaete carnosa HHB-10118-sp]
MTSQQTVIREVVKDIWTFSCPFSRFGFVPVGGRSTAIKLSSGDVWVLASTPLNDATKSKLSELGPVKYIVSADAVHHLFLGEFKKEYPSAKLIAPEEAIKKKTEEGLTFDGSWGKDPEDTTYGFEHDVCHLSAYFSGHQNKEVVFFHPSSKTLIEADLLFNLPANEQYSKSSSSGRIPLLGNMIHPWHGLHKKLAWAAGVDKAAMKRDCKAIADWDFKRIIPCHGDVIEERGKDAFMEAFKAFLD